ncbi:DUF2989 domain-containing protein [Vibrio sp. S9_S30]
MIKTQLLICIAFVATLSGCFEANRNTGELCEANPILQCEKLNMRDGQCRIPRTDLIWHRYEALRNNTVDKMLKEFEILHKYQQCLELAAQIQPIDQGDLKERRFNALVHTYDEQKRILNDLKSSTDPYALYFRWTQGDDEAQRQFLQLEGTEKLNTAKLQYALATYYANRDRNKTLTLLENALTLTQKGELNNEIIKSLASTNQVLGNLEYAYIWAMVGKEFELPIASDRNLRRMYPYPEEKLDKLNDLAEDVADAIKSGRYKPSLIPEIDTLRKW